jgi:two-component system chemotaxis response regulator CheY
MQNPVQNVVPLPRAPVFVVEDDYDIRESLVEVLRTGGYQAESAASSQEALQKIRALDPKPCLILLDLRLPGEDGFQFRAAQNLEPALASIPVLLLSADAHLQEKGEQLGAVGHLQKPVDIDELLATVERAYRI